MNNWTEGISRALDYIEKHLTDDMDIGEISRRAWSSAFHFQRIFSVLCGMPVGEYIRCRRLSCAAQDLSSTDAKIIDIALKYGYDSPDSFARAFQKFHGVNPSRARHAGVSLRSFSPMRIKISMEGGNMLEYRIEEKNPFSVVGVTRRFSSDTTCNVPASYAQIPIFWDEFLSQGNDRPILGTYALCLDSDGHEFDYMIADGYAPGAPVPKGCTVRDIPGGTWAVFPCTLATLQDTNTRMWSEWVPGSTGYRLSGNYNIEFYAPPTPDPLDSYCELWLPIEAV